MNWTLADWQRDLLEVTKRLIALRRENPALRPTRYARLDEELPGATEMHWFDARGSRMDNATWTAPENRTLQYLARAAPADGERNSTLVVLHGEETEKTVVLPEHDGILRYTLLWSSADDDGARHGHRAGRRRDGRRPGAAALPRRLTHAACANDGVLAPDRPGSA